MTREEFVAKWLSELGAILRGSGVLLGVNVRHASITTRLELLEAALQHDTNLLLDPWQGRLIQLHGRIPTKKNEKTIGPDSRTGKLKLWYGAEDRQRIADLVQYAALEWRDVRTGRLPAVEHPALCFEFYVQGAAGAATRTRYRKDRDNMTTTVLDALVKAGALVDDDIAHCNGRIQILPAVIGPTEGARIWVK
jgi:hypothetical protein